MRVLDIFFGTDGCYYLNKIQNGTFEIEKDRKVIHRLSSKSAIIALFEKIKIEKRKLTYKEMMEIEVSKLNIETKQKILDLMHKGKTIGEVGEELKLDTMVVCGVITENISNIHFLRTEAKQ